MLLNYILSFCINLEKNGVSVSWKNFTHVNLIYSIKFMQLPKYAIIGWYMFESIF